MRLKQQFENQIRIKGLSRETQKTYWRHIVNYLKFSKKGGSWVHPTELSTGDVERYLTHMAVRLNVSPVTQNCALQAILFMYRNCYQINLKGIDAIRAKKPKRLPVVMNRNEVSRLLAELDGPHLLLAQLMYGCGLRVSEAISVRMQDFDFDRGQLAVRSGKGSKDRFTCLPSNLKEPFQAQQDYARKLWTMDANQENAGVSLPFAYGRKSTKAHMDFRWWYLFPSKSLSHPPGDKSIKLRHHIHKSNVSRSIQSAVRRSGITKKVSPHTMRHSFATHLIESGVHIQQVSELLGHASIETTSIYLHCDIRNVNSRVSPLEGLAA